MRLKNATEVLLSMYDDIRFEIGKIQPCGADIEVCFAMVSVPSETERHLDGILTRFDA